MRKKPLLTTVQLVFMAVGSALVFPYTFMPILVTPPANQDVWIVLPLALVYIGIINAPIMFLINKFRGRSANDTIGVILGKPAGKAAAVIFVLFFLYCSTACMMIMGQFIKIYLKPETPTWALLVFMAVPIAYMSYKGAGTIGRITLFFVPFLMFTIIFFFAFGFSQMDIKQIKPVLADSTFLQLNEGAFLTAARDSEILIFFVFSFYIGEKASIIKTYAVALGIFAVCFLLILIPIILVLGDEYAKHLWSPYYHFATQVEAFGFLTRVQAFFVIALFPVSLLKLTMYNYMASHVFSGIVNSRTHKTFVIPFTLLSFIACLLPFMQTTDTFELFSSDQFFPFVILPVIFVLPLIMLIVYLIRRKKINVLLMSEKKTAGDS